MRESKSVHQLEEKYQTIQSKVKKETKVSPFNTIDLGSFKDVEVDHGVVLHDNKVIILNESHTTHVCSQVEKMVNSFGNIQAIVHDFETH